MEIIKIAVGSFIGVSAAIGFTIAIDYIVERIKEKKKDGK